MDRSRRGSLLLLCLLTACSAKKAEAPATPPTNPADQGAPVGAPAIPLAERVVLDSANLLFRAKDYPAALAAYRRAAAVAPTDVAPWFGVHMVATATNNKPLADSALAAMRDRGGAPDLPMPTPVDTTRKARNPLSPTAH